MIKKFDILYNSGSSPEVIFLIYGLKGNINTFEALMMKQGSIKYSREFRLIPEDENRILIPDKHYQKQLKW